MSETSSLRATVRLDLLLNERIEEPHGAAFLWGPPGLSRPKRGIEEIGIGHDRGLPLPDRATGDDPALSSVAAGVGARIRGNRLEHPDPAGGKGMAAQTKPYQIGAVISIGDQLEAPVAKQR